MSGLHKMSNTCIKERKSLDEELGEYSIKKSKLYNITKRVKEFGGEVFNSRTLYLSAAPLVLPTVYGEFTRTIKDYKNLSGAQKVGAVTSLVVGGALGVITTIGAIYAAENFDLEKAIYSIAGIANLISGIDEIASAVKNKKVKKKSLEASLN